MFHQLAKLSILAMFLGSGSLRAEEKGTQTKEDFYLGASTVDKVYNFEHKLEKGSETFRVAIIDNGSASNPISEAVISMAGQEGSDNPYPVHKVSLSVNDVMGVTAKWHNADNSSAGNYITILASRYNIVTEKDQEVEFQIKYTDSTNVYLEQLEVSSSVKE